ncbi:MAG TPA: glycosyltransferase family 9 protein [Candidatus Methylacidiphilales bacterium]|jgi:ADP-heptose:LPS heptosyltransferase|nr:glycosyltransferase family 9 protein [Candidatus Methylacidiphilales bacterium]
MSKFKTWLLSALPKPVSSALRSFRRTFRGRLDRLFFPVWLIFQCALHRRKAVVLWRTAAMGDIVCTLPLCGEIRKRHSGRLLVYITLRAFKNVVLLSREADIIYAIDHIYGRPSWIVSASRLLFGLVDHIYEPLTTDERTAFKVGPQSHLIDDLATSCGFTLSNRQPSLFPPVELLENARATYGISGDMAKGRLIIGINGGHSWPVKEWDAAKWQKLVDMIHAEYDAVVLQFGLNLGPGVPDAYNDFKGVRSLVNRLSSEDLVALIASCHLIVSIDSGPVHVAGAVRTPVIGLFGANDFRYRLPPDSPGVGLVSDVPCLYCHHRTPIEHWKTGCPHDIRCMKLLDVEPVFQAIRTMLSKRDKKPLPVISGSPETAP